MRILAFETWDAGSHRAVRESISAHAAHDWTWITLSGRAWAWRMRLGAHDALRELDRLRRADPARFAAPFDAVVATSLISLGDLRAGLGRSYVKLDAPFVLYMHENQVVYPLADDAPDLARRDVQPALTNLTSVLAADRVLWNSAWNRESFIDGIERVLRHAPRETRGVLDVDALRARSAIAWPPVESPPETLDVERRRPRDADVPLRIIWPHRWEHDKDPAALLECMASLPRDGSVCWTILGSTPPADDPRRLELHERFGSILDQVGHEPDRSAYWAHLAASDWVLSTARHEFFGLAVAEALRAGCLPWLPARLSYPELLPEPGWAGTLSPLAPPNDPGAVRRACQSHLEASDASVAVRRIEAEIERARDGRIESA